MWLFFQRSSWFKLCWVAMPVLLLLGCRNMRFGSFVTPEIRGQVLADDSGIPLSGATVVRMTLRGQAAESPGQEKGAQYLTRERPVMTDAQGRFVLKSRSYLFSFHPGSGLVCIKIEVPHFEVVTTNLTTGDVIPGKDPQSHIIDMGAVKLRPLGP